MRDFTLALAGVMDEIIAADSAERAGLVNPDRPSREDDVANDYSSYRAALAAGLDEQEQRAFAQARAEVRMVLQDLLEWSRDFGPGFAKAIDPHFAAAGLPTVSQMQREVWKTIPKVLTRGRIRTEAEYYLLIERLNDVSDTDGLSQAERDQISQMVADFEARKANPKKRGR
jgi:hypothetical protein